MTKTIEEAARTIAKDFIMEHKSRINNDAPLTHECVEYAIERVLAMPLCERLTAEEKERVRKAHHDCHRYMKGNIKNHLAAYDTCMTLESIFGSDFFKEGE